MGIELTSGNEATGLQRSAACVHHTQCAVWGARGAASVSCRALRAALPAQRVVPILPKIQTIPLAGVRPYPIYPQKLASILPLP
jgi:hypothetical protein